MRYLKHKDDFLKNTEFLKEVFENDITWGGSLLGRLINSTIRKAKIGYNYTKVNSIVKQVEDQINNLYSYYANEEDKSKISDLVSRFLIEEVYKVSNSDQEIEKKLDILLGNKSTESLIDTTIGEVNKTSIDGKEDLIEKLKKFKEDLLKLRQELGLTEGEGESEEEVENPSDGKEEDKVKVFYMNSKSLLESICKIHRDIKNNTVKFQSGVSDQIKVGNTYLYTNSNGKTNKVKVISLTNVVDDGKDDAFLTPDDVKQKQIEKGYVSVTILDGNDHSNPTVAVNPKLLKKAPENTSSTFFDDEKYKKQRTNTESEIKQKIELAKKGLSVYKASQSKERINFYNNEINKLTNLLNTKFNKKVSKSPVTVTSNESFILEEVDAHMRDQESDAKMAWNKVVNAYNKSGIVKYIPYIESIIKIEGADKEKIVKNKKSIMNIGRQVVINYDNVGKPMSYQELISEQEGFSTSDVAKSISLFGRVLLAFSEDMGLLGSYGASYKAEGDAGGAGNHIKLFIKSFNSIKEAYPLLKKESNSFSSLLRYQYFKMIREAQDDVEDNISIDEPESISKENPETGSTDTEQTEEKETTDVEVDAPLLNDI